MATANRESWPSVIPPPPPYRRARIPASPRRPSKMATLGAKVARKQPGGRRMERNTANL